MKTNALQTIGGKIILGFSFVLLLLVVIGFSSHSAISGASKGFEEYRGASISGRVQANMLQARIAVKNFVQYAEEKYYNQFRVHEQEMLDYIEKAQAEITLPEQYALVNDIDEDWGAYTVYFGEVADLVRERTEIIDERLNVYGTRARTQITEIMNATRDSGQYTQSLEAATANQHLLLARIYVRRFMETYDASASDRVKLEVQKMNEQFTLLKKDLTDDAAIRQLDSAIDDIEKYESAFDELVLASNTCNDILHNKLDVIGPNITATSESLYKLQSELQLEIGTEVATANARAINVILVTAIAAIILGFGIAIFIARSISNPIKALANNMREITSGDGDLTRRSGSTRKDEVGEISRSFDLFVEKIEALVVATHNVSSHVSHACASMRDITVSVNDSISEQDQHITTAASAVEELHASAEEMGGSGKVAAEDTEAAANMASDGKRSVNDTVSIMKRIADGVQGSSDSMKQLATKVDDIRGLVDTINDIADQTNLLALNAAIEAAGAGEHGKGFAVVADEVRKLADRTTQATAEVAQAISGIHEEAQRTMEITEQGIDDVEQGLAATDSSGLQLKEIEAKNQSLSSIMAHVVNSVTEQTAATQQISSSMQTILSLSNSTSESTQESIGSINHLESQVKQLGELLERSNLNTGNAAKTGAAQIAPDAASAF